VGFFCEENLEMSKIFTIFVRVLWLNGLLALAAAASKQVVNP
jgi:hypothetical protein